MYAQVEKPKEKVSNAVANDVSHKQGGDESVFQFVDNRSEAVAQMKLHEMANNSPRVKHTTQIQAMADKNPARLQKPIQKKENNNGPPDNLKSGFRHLSGMDISDVKVHYNSDKHVVNQKLGSVQSTRQLKSKVAINDDKGLEKKAGVMRAKALEERNLHSNIQVAQMAKINPENLDPEVTEIYNLLPHGFKSILLRVPEVQFAPFYTLSPRQQVDFFHLLRATGQIAIRVLMSMPQQNLLTSGEQTIQLYPLKIFQRFLTQNRNIIQQILGMATGRMGAFHLGKQTFMIDRPSLLKMSSFNLLKASSKLLDKRPMTSGPKSSPPLKLKPSTMGGLDKDVMIVQNVIHELQTTASPQALENSDFKKLTESIQLCLEKIPEGKKQDKVDQLREMIDKLPEEYSELVVNMAHKALNPYDYQLSIPDAKFLGPSRVQHSTLVKKFEGDQQAQSISSKDDHSHISNRGIQQIVRIEGQLYTTIYMTVFADASGKKGRPKHKDFEQDENGQIMIHTGGKGPGENTLWISIGRPLRQIKWMELYGSKNGTPLIRSFLIPLAVANAISGETATEHKTSGYDVDFNVDKHYEMNQTGINKGSSLEMLRRYALPGSLRTYSDPSVFDKKPAPKHWGDTRSIHELNEKMGIPNEPLTKFNVFVDRFKGDFTSQTEYGEQAKTLSRIYAYYTENSYLLPENENMPGDAKEQANAFYRENRPNNEISIEDFMEKFVSPWASQAQISKIIADDYQGLVLKAHELPEKAPEVSFTSKSRKGHRGERRSASVTMSKQIQTLLQSRYDFLGALHLTERAILNVFGNQSYQGDNKKYLGPIHLWIKKLQKNYDFVGGNVEIVKKDFPEYRSQAHAYLEMLEKNCSSDKTITPVTEALRNALFVKIAPSQSSSGFSVPVSFGSLSSGSNLSQDQVDVVESGQVLHANNTAGGGDCFYHSIYEALNYAKSDGGTQQEIRDQIVLAIRGNTRLAASHFGTGPAGQTAIQRFIQEVSTQSTWVPDHGPAIVADALRIRIIIHRPNGAVYYDAQPNTTIVGGVSATIHLQYTGAHYNSYTADAL